MSETPKREFSDLSTVSRIVKAKRVLYHLASEKDNRYFHDDGFPRTDIHQDAAAAVDVLEHLERENAQLQARVAELSALLKESRQYVMAYSPSGQPFDFPKELIGQIDKALSPAVSPLVGESVVDRRAAATHRRMPDGTLFQLSKPDDDYPDLAWWFNEASGMWQVSDYTNSEVKAKFAPVSPPPAADVCSKGGTHEWTTVRTTDGKHQSVFCGKCYLSKPAMIEAGR